jgi:hypothetical protein
LDCSAAGRDGGGGGYSQEFPLALGLPFWSTVAGLALDAAVVAAFALCIAALSTVSVLPLALGAAFAVAGKALGATMDYLARGADGDEELLASYSPIVDRIRWLLPDLSRLDWREWSMYQLAPGAETVFWSVSMAVALHRPAHGCCQPAVLAAGVLLMRRSLSVMTLFMGVLSVLVYGYAQHRLSALARPTAAPELLISLPRFAQVLMAGGDRYLAANLAGFRVLVADTGRMNAEDYAVQAKLQRDIAWFNPLHEDNYYIGAAILPWNGELDAAQYVLRRASDARTFDWYPLFHYGFLFYHFRKDPATGAQWLLKGVPRVTNQQDEWALQNLAAIWIEKGYQTANAATMVDAMAANSPPGAFRNYLQVRAIACVTWRRCRTQRRFFRPGRAGL